MPKKFDTNPLDPEFPEKAKETQTETLPQQKRETAKIPQPAETEEPTRRYQNAYFAPFSPTNDKNQFDEMQSPFNQAQPPSLYQTATLHSEKPSSRKVSRVGLPENILVALPYVPFFVGLVAGILELLFVPKSEAKVRFHAAQGLAAHLGILIVTTILSGVGNIVYLANVGNLIFQVVTGIMLIIWTIKAFQGKPVHIESVDDLTEWLEEKIKPQK